MRPTESIPTVETLENRQLLSTSPSFIGRLPGSLPVAGTSHISVRLTDTGTLPTNGPVVVQLFASTQTAVDASAVSLGSKQVNLRLCAGRGINTQMEFPTPTTLANGDYFLLAEVDGSIAVAATSKPVGIAMPFSDVSLSFARLPSQPIAIDNEFSGCSTATVAITNTGNIPARGKVDVSLYLSTDATLDAADPLLASASNHPIALQPSHSAPIRFSVIVPPGTAVGGYFLIATLTPAGNLIDSNPANNTATSASRISVITQSTNSFPQHRRDYQSNDSDVIYYADAGCDAAVVTDDDGGDAAADTTNTPDDSSQDAAPTTTPDNSPPASDTAATTPDTSTDNSSDVDTWDSADIAADGGSF